jgi:carbamoyl-phosphate synthase small subunit
MYATFVLEDGTIVDGTGFGAEGKAFGEAVFNTSMSGYQEALTDPSYNGQILMLTYPMIGNYGVNVDDFESDRIKVEGFAVRENCHMPSHRDSGKTIDKFLEESGIPGIAGVDTRALTIKIRKYGTMKAALATSSKKIDAEDLLDRAKKQKDITELDLVKEVTSREIQRFEGPGAKIALIDCGTKLSILRHLQKRKCDVTVFPADSEADEILDAKPQGIVISNGPGDPLQAPYAIKTIKELLGQKPMFGICFGNQLLALAAGAATYKLKFGHRGSNQPVKDLATGKVYITSQNHGFAVDEKSLDGTGFEVSFINLNDNTVEGIYSKEFEASSFQYHPEANPGPHDSEYLFGEFLKTIKGD